MEKVIQARLNLKYCPSIYRNLELARQGANACVKPHVVFLGDVAICDMGKMERAGYEIA